MDGANPKWILGVGCGLAFLAAAVNTSFLMGVGASVSHLTGDLSRVAIEVTRQREVGGVLLGQVMAALVGFVVGAMLAGLLIHHPSVKPSRPYGKSIGLIGVVLLGSSCFLERYVVVAILLASMGCGLQNALATHFRGMVLRTTHVTGLLTDFGMTVGMRLRGHAIPFWKILVPLCLVVGFLLGSGVGAVLTLRVGVGGVTWLMGWVYVGIGVAWAVVRHAVLPRWGAGES